MALKRTALFYKNNPDARKKKAEYDKKYNKKKRSYRAKLGRENYKRRGKKRAPKGSDGQPKNLSHTKNGLRYKNGSVNKGSKSDSPGDKRARGKTKK